MPARPTRPRPFVLAVASLALGLMVSTLPARSATEWEPIPAEAWDEAARPDSGGANAILLLDREDCVQKESSFTLDRLVRARVFTAAGRDAGTVQIFYIRKEWKLAEVRGRSVRPGGSVTELDPATIVTSTVWKTDGGELLRATVNVPGVEPGCIVEVAYTLTGSVGFSSGWRFRFSNDYYTCLSTHSWQVPRSAWVGRQPGVKYANAFTLRIRERREPDEKQPTKITFSARGLQGVRDEPFAPPSSDAAPQVDVVAEAAGSDPTEYWSWWKQAFDNYLESLVRDSRHLKTRLGEFRSGSSDTLAALHAAYEWLQRNIASNEDVAWARRGEAQSSRDHYRWARTADELLERREADPLEINALMMAFAQGLGLRANVALAGDRRYGRFDARSRGWPTGSFLTIVWLPEGPLYLQPSSRFSPFGEVPWFLRGGDCLLAGGGKLLFTRVSVDAGRVATTTWDLDLTLAATGELAGHLSARSNGEDAGEWKRRLWDVDPARWAETAANWFGERDGPKLTVQPVDLGSAGDSSFVLEAAARWPEIAVVGGDAIEVPFNRLAPWRTTARFLLERRTVPILFRFPREEWLRVRLHLPDGFRADGLPSPAAFHSEVGDWSVAWKSGPDGVEFERRVELHHGEFPIRSYAQVREFFETLDAADQVPLQLVRGS